MRTDNDTPDPYLDAVAAYAKRRDLTAWTTFTGDTPSGYRRFVPVNLGNVLVFGPGTGGPLHWLVVPNYSNERPTLIEFDTPRIWRAAAR